jgi:hypothetical protein
MIDEMEKGPKKNYKLCHVNFLFNNMACPWRWPSPDCIAEFGAAVPLAVISGRKEGMKEGSLVGVVECKVLNRLFSCMCFF